MNRIILTILALSLCFSCKKEQTNEEVTQQQEVKEQVYACGMNDFVTKPFNPYDLRDKMAAYVK